MPPDPKPDYSRAKGSRSGKVKTCAADGCENTFYVYPSRIGYRFCSRDCAYRSRDAQSESDRQRRSISLRGKRRGRQNPNYRHGGRAGERDRERERAWYAMLAPRCGHPEHVGSETLRDLHHVVYRQRVRAAGGDLYDPRNALTLCHSCHASHHRRGRVVPLSALSNANYAFATDLLGAAAYDYLRLRYSGDDPRLEAILST